MSSSFRHQIGSIFYDSDLDLLTFKAYAVLDKSTKIELLLIGGFWINFDSTNLIFTGTPTKDNIHKVNSSYYEQMFRIEVSAFDTCLESATASFYITIVNQAPLVGSPTLVQQFK